PDTMSPAAPMPFRSSDPRTTESLPLTISDDIAALGPSPAHSSPGIAAATVEVSPMSGRLRVYLRIGELTAGGTSLACRIDQPGRCHRGCRANHVTDYARVLSRGSHVPLLGGYMRCS